MAKMTGRLIKLRSSSLSKTICKDSGTKPHFPRSLFTFSEMTNKKKEYVKKELIGYSTNQMFEVVSDVSNYYKFVPYVNKSHVHSKFSNGFKADMIVRFPPINEEYTSKVTLDPPSLVKSVCTNGQLLNCLSKEWKLSPGLKDIPQSCVLDFTVSFEFKSLLHTKISNLFFNLICDQMENALILEAKKRFGSPTIRNHTLSSRRT